MRNLQLASIKYSKPKRFVRPGAEIPPERVHRYLSPEDERYLMSGRVVVEEKMDGSPVDFAAGNRYIIFAEDLRRKHSILYRVPGRYAIFDIFDSRRGVFASPEEKAELSRDVRKGLLRAENIPPESFFPVAVVACGIFPGPSALAPLMGVSAYAIDQDTRTNTYMEGIVIKPDRELYPEEQVRGKLIRQEFEDGIGEHYLRLPEVRNIIDPAAEIVVAYPAYPSFRSP